MTNDINLCRLLIFTHAIEFIREWVRRRMKTSICTFDGIHFFFFFLNELLHRIHSSCEWFFVQYTWIFYCTKIYFGVFYFITLKHRKVMQFLKYSYFPNNQILLKISKVLVHRVQTYVLNNFHKLWPCNFFLFFKIIFAYNMKHKTKTHR